MKLSAYWKEFFKIGLMAAGGGPLILAIIYAMLHRTGVITALPAEQVVLGIVTSLLLAFISGGISVLYRIDSLPLLWASLAHASILYLDYLIIYLVNGWIPRTLSTVLAFTLLFLAIYLVVWVVVWLSIRRAADRLTKKLRT